MATDTRTDREGLAGCVTIPALVAEVRWAVRPLGASTSELPGPADLEVAAFLALGDGPRRVVARELGRVEGAAPLELDAALAAAVLPPEVLAAAPATADGAGVVLAGPQLDPRPLARAPFLPRAAVEVEGGLVVVLRRL